MTKRAYNFLGTIVVVFSGIMAGAAIAAVVYSGPAILPEVVLFFAATVCLIYVATAVGHLWERRHWLINLKACARRCGV